MSAAGIRWTSRCFTAPSFAQSMAAFRFRLTVTHRADGQWHGRSTVPVLTDIQRELFQQAKANEPILCRRGKPKYPWWRKEIEQNV